MGLLRNNIICITYSNKKIFGTEINCCLLNARSIVHKFYIILDLISDHDLDVLFITESWFTEETFTTFNAKLKRIGFGILHLPRGHSGDLRRGVGIAIIYNNCVKVDICNTTHVSATTTFEHCEFEISTSHLKDTVCIIYRPQTDVNGKSTATPF